jgi:hypothetical protein
VRTDDLIGALSRDAAIVVPWWHRPAPVLAIGACLATIAFALVLTIRADLLSVHGIGPTLYKWAFAVSLAGFGTFAALRFRQPGASFALFPWMLLVLTGLLAAGTGLDLWSNGAAGFMDRMAGSSALACLQNIGWLSIIPLVAFLVLLRAGATTSPGLAGFAAGLSAAGFAAFLYALKCTEDNLTFVVAWYGLAALIVGGITAVFGRWLLRW